MLSARLLPFLDFSALPLPWFVNATSASVISSPIGFFFPGAGPRSTSGSNLLRSFLRPNSFSLRLCSLSCLRSSFSLERSSKCSLVASETFFTGLTSDLKKLVSVVPEISSKSTNIIRIIVIAAGTLLPNRTSSAPPTIAPIAPPLWLLFPST